MSDDLIRWQPVCATWHYQLMKHTYDIGEDVYAVHEYYPMDSDGHGDSWTTEPVTVEGDSVEDVKKILMMIYNDIDKHGVKDYE